LPKKTPGLPVVFPSLHCVKYDSSGATLNATFGSLPVIEENMEKTETGLILAYVLTLLPGRVFQVFQVVGGEEKRKKREFIDNLFKSIISVYICFKCFSSF
jgi:hypothetical protein